MNRLGLLSVTIKQDDTILFGQEAPELLISGSCSSSHRKQSVRGGIQAVSVKWKRVWNADQRGSHEYGNTERTTLRLSISD